MYRRFIVSCVCAGGLAFATSMAATSVIAQETKSSDASATRNQGQHDSKTAIDAQIEKLSKRVDLTSDQKDQLRAQMAKENGKTQKLWQQFADTHVQVIRQEAEMLAALEDVMEPEQKQKAQQNREAKAKGDSSKNSQHADAKKSERSNDQHATDAANKDQSAKTKQDANKSASSVDKNSSTTAKNSATAKTGQHDGKNGTDKSHAAGKSDKQQQTEEYVWTMVIVPAQVELEPLGLSNDQQQQCDEVYHNYHQTLVQGWQKIDQLHDQLVALEAQQILDVEKILTDAQRQKLMNNRHDSNKKDSSKNSKVKS